MIVRVRNLTRMFQQFLTKVYAKFISKTTKGFDVFGIHPTILKNIYSLGYQIPTPIQCHSIPPILLGQDVLGLAQTGTGKTAAFALPIIHRLLASPRSGGVRALIVAPM